MAVSKNTMKDFAEYYGNDRILGVILNNTRKVYFHDRVPFDPEKHIQSIGGQDFLMIPQHDSFEHYFMTCTPMEFIEAIVIADKTTPLDLYDRGSTLG